MGLLTALKLPTPPSLAARSGSKPPQADEAAANQLRNDIDASMKTALGLAATLSDRDRKVALAQALVVADKQRIAADRMTDPAGRLAALKAARSRIETATAAASVKPKTAAAATDARSAAAALKPQIDAELVLARKAYAVANAVVAAAEAEAAAAAKSPPWEKKVANEQKAAADKQLAAVQRRLKELDDDATALASASTSEAALQALLARRKVAVALTSVDQLIVLPRSGLTGAKSVAASSELKNGVATTTTDERSRKWGPAEVTDRREQKAVAVDGSGLTRTTSTSTAATMGLAGASREVTRTQQYEKDGQTTSIERKSNVGVTTSGNVTAGKSVTAIAKDGSRKERSTSGATEHGDGKAGATATTARTVTDASGVATKTSATGKGGLVAGAEGIGGYGDGELGYEKKRPGGLQTDAVGGLSGNIVASVTADATDPTMFFVTVTIDLGLRLNLSTGYDKEPEKGKPDEERRSTVKVSAGASGKVTMEASHRLGAAQAAGYVAALKTGNGTDREFAIIRCGLKQGWPAAQQLYLGLSGQTASQASVDKLAKGESIKTGKEGKLSGGIDVGTRSGSIGGGVSLGGEVGRDGSIAVSKDQDGKVSYDLRQGESMKGNVGARVNAGVAEGSFSVGHGMTTSTGYKIQIPPGTDPKLAAVMQAAMNACSSQAELDAFARRYPKAVQETTRQQGSSDTRDVSAGLGGQVKVGVKYGNAIDEQRTVDADGKLKESRVTGSNDSGAELTLFGRKIADSSKQQAVSTTDAAGHSRTDVSQSDNATDMARLAASLPFSGEKPDGALTAATGGGDTGKKNLSGIGLGDGELKRLGQMACGDWNAWMHAPLDGDDRKAWGSAGKRIKQAGGDPAKVADELARFVGSSDRQRMQVIYDTLRGSKGTGGGARYEFPGALAALKADYDRVVVADSEQAVLAAATEPDKPKKEADALLAALDKLFTAVDRESEFRNPSTRAEMLAAINARKARVRAALRASAGAPVAQTVEDHKQRYNELLVSCRNCQQDEKKLFDKVQANLDGGGHTVIENVKLVNELNDLYKIWDPEYEEMATLAQTHGFGTGIFDRYRPNRPAYQLAHDNKSPLQGKGKDKAVAPLSADEKNRKVDPKARTVDEVRADRKTEDDERVKKGTQIQKDLPALQKQAWDRSQMLDGFISAEPKPAAAKCMEQGAKLYDEGVSLKERVHKDHMPELVDLGAKALDKFRAALALFNKGIAAYPKDWAKTGR